MTGSSLSRECSKSLILSTHERQVCSLLDMAHGKYSPMLWTSFGLPGTADAAQTNCSSEQI
jgi:hypothetical protein